MSRNLALLTVVFLTGVFVATAILQSVAEPGGDSASESATKAREAGGQGASCDTPAQETGNIVCFPRCEHPWPCADGSEWPADLVPCAAPDAPKKCSTWPLPEPKNEKIPGWDGTKLDAWVYVPDLPGDVKAPAIIWAAAYFGSVYPPGDNKSQNDDSNHFESVPVNLLLENGYAVVLVSSRGTGLSEGCYAFGGDDELRDYAAVIEWVASQEWSNKRVGMMGTSQHAMSALMATIQNPPALKTIVVSGLVSDVYTRFYSPQGASMSVAGGPNLVNQMRQLVGPPTQEDNLALATVYPTLLPGRHCLEQTELFVRLHESALTDHRERAIWEPRQIAASFPQATASVFLAHGFQDPGQLWQDDTVWEAFEIAPKRMIEGQWVHTTPKWGGYAEWNIEIMAWFDFWLKGIGPVPPLDTVEYQDDGGKWHPSTAWPPTEAGEEALFLVEGRIETSPAAGVPGSFLASPRPETKLCYSTEALTSEVLLAGNPYAYLSLESNLMGGMVSIDLYEASAGDGCPGADAQVLTYGRADLRFLDGNFDGKDFPIGTPTGVRIDLANLAAVVEEGKRLVLVLRGPEPMGEGCPAQAAGLTANGGCATNSVGQPYYPTILVRAENRPLSSQLVLPLVEGTLGGQAPTDGIPARPFT